MMNTKQLISAAELQDEADFASDFYGPGWRDDPATRRIVNALVDAEAAVRAFEDAARLRANPWRKLETAPRGEVIMYCDARGNRWIDVHPGHPANSLGYPPTCWMPLPDGPSSSPSQIDHSNGSARHNGQSETASAVHAKAFHKMAAAICCPPAVDDDEPARLRAKGAL